MYKIAKVVKSVIHNARFRLSSTAVFNYPGAQQINIARTEHLMGVKLEIHPREFGLEVGAGIGLLSPTFKNFVDFLVVTDGRKRLVNVIRKRLQNLLDTQVTLLDCESPTLLRDLCQIAGSVNRNSSRKYDIVFCYGLLYHLSDPMKFLGTICPLTETIIIESAVDPDAQTWSAIAEPKMPNAALHSGSRPGAKWLIDYLQAHFLKVLIFEDLPKHPDFGPHEPEKIDRTQRVIVIGTNGTISATPGSLRECTSPGRERP